jgi:CRP-like cAMP-binding protein
LDDAALYALTSKSKRAHLPMGTTVFHQGTSGIPLLVVLQGCIRLERPLTTTETVRLALVGEGEAVDELSFASGLPTTCHAIAIEDTDVLELSHDDFITIAKRHSSVCNSMLQTLAKRLRESNDKVHSLLALDASARLAREILAHAPQNEQRGAVDISLPYSQEELAHRIGTRRETVNRCLKELKQEGVLSDSGRNRYKADLPNLYRTAGFTVVRSMGK